MLIPRQRERLKLAQALQQQLIDPHPQSVCAPQVHWDRFRETCERLNMTRHRGWQTASRSVADDVTWEGNSLIRQIENLVDDVGRQIQPPVRATLREILEDLEALENEFPEVTWDLREETLSVLTEPVVLEGISLGRFTIQLGYGRLEKHQPYSVIARDPNPAAGDDSTPHPHVRNDDLCEGEGAASIRNAIRQGRFYDLFILIRSILNTYNAGSAYITLKNWFGISCPECGDRVNEDDLSSCERCESDYCGECGSSCSRCYRGLCSSCSDMCGTCGDSFCRDCLKECPGCHDYYCARCLENDRCEDCQETNDEEDENETDKPQPEVQPVCVVEAGEPEGPGTD